MQASAGIAALGLRGARAVSSWFYRRVNRCKVKKEKQKATPAMPERSASPRSACLRSMPKCWGRMALRKCGKALSDPSLWLSRLARRNFHKPCPRSNPCCAASTPRRDSQIAIAVKAFQTAMISLSGRRLLGASGWSISAGADGRRSFACNHVSSMYVFGCARCSFKNA